MAIKLGKTICCPYQPKSTKTNYLAMSTFQVLNAFFSSVMPNFTNTGD